MTAAAYPASRRSCPAQCATRAGPAWSCALAILLLAACAGAPKEPQNARLAQAADYNRRGEAALKQGDYRKALALYEAALQTDLSVENLDGVAINSINLARLHQMLGEDARAHQRLDAVLGGGDIFSREYIAAARLRKAMLYQAENDLDAAASWAAQTADLCQDSACIWQGTLLNLRARLALARGDFAGALTLAGQALVVNRGRDAREEAANSLRLQAEARIGQKEFAAALAPLDEALALDKALGLPQRIEQDLQRLADAHAGLGHVEEARALRTRAARVASQEMKID
jgi:tetratricopeptide (TPR) repeat protein